MSTQTGRAIGYSRGGQAAERGCRAKGRSENPVGAFEGESRGGGGTSDRSGGRLKNLRGPDKRVITNY